MRTRVVRDAPRVRVQVPAAGVVAEQMVAYVLANESIRKFGGDTVGDFADAHGAYLARLEAF